jgi:hypothetical protein
MRSALHGDARRVLGHECMLRRETNDRAAHFHPMATAVALPDESSREPIVALGAKAMASQLAYEVGDVDVCDRHMDEFPAATTRRRERAAPGSRARDLRA